MIKIHLTYVQNSRKNKYYIKNELLSTIIPCVLWAKINFDNFSLYNKVCRNVKFKEKYFRMQKYPLVLMATFNVCQLY